MSHSSLLRLKRKEILQKAAQYGVDNIRVFGSVVQQLDRPDSDIDFLVSPQSHTSLLDIVALTYELEDLLGCKVDIVSEKGLSPYIQAEILAQAVPL